MSDPQQPHGLQPSRLLLPWDFPGKSTGVGCHCLLHYQSEKQSTLKIWDFPGQWLRLHTSTAGSTDSMPSQGTKILHAVQCSKEKKKKKKFNVLSLFKKKKNLKVLVPSFSLHHLNLGPLYLGVRTPHQVVPSVGMSGFQLLLLTQ